MSDITAFPLAWPTGWKRTTQRERANFHRRVTESYRGFDGTSRTRTVSSKLTIADSRDRLRDELRMLGAHGVVISSNLRLRLDGEPRSGQSEPAEPGVCVYFNLNGAPRCLPCDRWDRAADNLAAIAKFVEAMRGQIRWGVGSADVAFAGFKSLPPPAPIGSVMKPEDAAAFVARFSVNSVASQLLGDRELCRQAYREAAKKLHPDSNGGQQPDAWSKLQEADAVLRRHWGMS